MYVTALLLFLLLICFIVSCKKDYAGPRPFDKAATLPLRGLLALLIISHHLGQGTDIYLLSNFTAGIGMQIVAVFFFMSGYGLCVSYMAKRESYLAGFLRKRMGKLLPEFLILTAGVMIYSCIRSVSIETQAIAFIRWGATPLPFSWFIYAIIYVYLAFYLCARVGKEPKYVGALFTVAIILYVFVSSKVLRFPSWWHVTIITVSLGYYVALYEQKISRILSRKKVFCYATSAALLVVPLFVRWKLGLFVSTWIEIWVLAQAMSVYVIIRTLGMVQWKWLCATGVFSLELYLVHGIPLKICQHIGLQNWLLWLFTYALSIPLALLLNRLSERIFHQRRPHQIDAA